MILDSYHKILGKLKRFIAKYYTQQLIRGGLLFLTLGLLFWMVVLSLEFSLWLDKCWRTVLFFAFLVVEVLLVYRFILTPILYLLRIKRGISNKEASRLIGEHFPQIDDKLFNLLELSGKIGRSELLIASIEQRSKGLQGIPFVKAINVKEGFKYARYIVVPLIFVAIIWITGDAVPFFSSHERIVNYDLAYEQPAPFRFKVLNDKLEVFENEPLTIQVAVEGKIKPENVYIVTEREEMILKQQGGIFTHTFQPPIPETEFYLIANGWESRKYAIKSLLTPSISGFRMELDFPSYLKRSDEVLEGTGNAVVPEGTTVTWKIRGKNIEKVEMGIGDTNEAFAKKTGTFSFSTTLFDRFDYEVSTSSAQVKAHEQLNYALDVVKDAPPTIKVTQVLDSLNPNMGYYTGQVADDHGLAVVRLVCFPSDNREKEQRVVLESLSSNIHQFYYTFPSGLALEEDKSYKLYFEVVDNDGLRGGKVTKSKVFDAVVLNGEQLRKKQLQAQGSVLKNMGRFLQEYKEQQKNLSNINDGQKEQSELDFEEKRRIKDFLEKQEEQELLMERFTKQLREGLDKQGGDETMKKLLKERLERQEMEAQKNERLLDELKKIADKVEKHELGKKLEELGEKQSSSTRNLEQILELTKRYYVSEKMIQLSKEFEKLAEEQERLSKEDRQNEKGEQQNLNKDFDGASEELEELKKDNDKLRRPMKINGTKNEQERVKQDQKEALKELENTSDENRKNPAAAAQKQKSAAQKMREISKSLQQGAMVGGGSSAAADAEMLRQILDNLITFSFKQESLMENVENANVSRFSRMVRDQKELRRLFEHVDDSLFSLSLRRVELSELVNEQVGEVYYNIDKALESIAQNELYRGASHQQYTVNATNILADFLANVLDNMQQSMQSGNGNGQGGSDFQLPDIIRGQQNVQDKMDSSKDNRQKRPNKKSERKEGRKERRENMEDGEKQEFGKQPNGAIGGKGKRDGQTETEPGEIYEIYKQQQYLRQQLEKQLQDLIQKQDKDLAKKLIRQMEEFENDLLENGITQRTKDKASTIRHELLKLKNAALEKGNKKERRSRTNMETFSSPITSRPELLREHQNDIEILNRQALPLRKYYESKIKQYFGKD